MNKTLLNLAILLAATSLVVLCFNGAMAKVSGPCVDCHTMHFSQDGAQPGDPGFPTAPPYDKWLATQPQEALLVDDCIGCHSDDTALAGTNNEIPIVLRTALAPGTGPGQSLAGGDFYWVAQAGNDVKGHNVMGVAPQDGPIGLTPPGWDPDATPGLLQNDEKIHDGDVLWTEQLRCAGKYGCHGRHDEVTEEGAVRGGHHGDDSVLKPGSVDEIGQGQDIITSYRWLGGIHGIEDPDWEWTAIAIDHNQYKGTDGNSNYTHKTTISYSCAQCHGDFHSDIDTGTGLSPWIRHPTDFNMARASGTEYTGYNGGSGTANPYSVVAPVGSDNLSDGVLSQVDISIDNDTAIVLCVSCHRAHGSEYDDILRWDYFAAGAEAGQPTTPNTGCFICHTTK